MTAIAQARAARSTRDSVSAALTLIAVCGHLLRAT